MSRLLAAAWCCAALALAACSSSTPSHPSTPLITAPYLELSDPGHGVVVLPSSGQWIVLSTSDGFAHLQVRTPLGVDTAGGLSVAGGDEALVVAVAPHEKLLRSPVLTARGRAPFTVAELPGAVSPARGSVAASSGVTYAVLASSHGTLVRSTEHGWTTVVTAQHLPGAAGFHMDAVAVDGTDELVTGHGPAGAPTAYRSTDAGAHWAAVQGTANGAVAALPAHGPAPWAVPVIDGAGVLRVVAPDGHRGAAIHTGPAPVVGSFGTTFFAVDSGGRIEQSGDSGAHWTERGSAPADLSAIAPTGSGDGYAVSGGGTPQLWRITGNGARFTRIALPPWVATLGNQGGMH